MSLTSYVLPKQKWVHMCATIRQTGTRGTLRALTTVTAEYLLHLWIIRRKKPKIRERSINARTSTIFLAHSHKPFRSNPYQRLNILSGLALFENINLRPHKPKSYLFIGLLWLLVDIFIWCESPNFQKCPHLPSSVRLGSSPLVSNGVLRRISQ